MKTNHYDGVLLDLRLFDGEGGGAMAGGVAGGVAGGAGEGVPDGAAAADPTQGLSKNELRNVQYGRAGTETPADAAPKATQTQVQSNAEDARRAEFERLIKGDFKDLYGERTQQMLDARFKEFKVTSERLQGMQPILDALAAKYGVGADDVAGLRAAIEEDDSYFEEEAERKGLTVEQYKAWRKMEAENEGLRQAEEQRRRQAEANQIQAKWQAESDACRQIYPAFDLRGELQAPETGRRFADLLKNNVDVKTAYEIIHKDELLSGAIGYAVQSAQRRTVDSIRARGMRPTENGASGAASAQIAKTDVTKFTKRDREEIARRVLRGERVEL